MFGRPFSGIEQPSINLNNNNESDYLSEMSWTSYGPFYDFSILDPFLDDFLALKSKTLSPFFILSEN
jgi:hypothetical protein